MDYLGRMVIESPRNIPKGQNGMRCGVMSGKGPHRDLDGGENMVEKGGVRQELEATVNGGIAVLRLLFYDKFKIHLPRENLSEFVDMYCIFHFSAAIGKNGFIHSECGTACPKTCSNHLHHISCHEHCIDGFFCPSSLVTNGTHCIKKEECTCTHEKKVYRRGESFAKDCNRWYDNIALNALVEYVVVC